MSLLTAEHPTAHQPNPVQHAGSTDLVRPIGGVHVPVAGPWDVGSGQRLDLAAHGLRTRALSARVHCGTLLVTDDLLGSSLDFTIFVPDASCCVSFSTRVTRLLSVESWQADGTTTTDSGSRPVSLRLHYNGVFRQRGRPPCLWLSIQAAAELPELGAAIGSRRAGRLKVAAELNLNPRGAR